MSIPPDWWPRPSTRDRTRLALMFFGALAIVTIVVTIVLAVVS